MPVRHAILGLLAKGSLHGYEIKKQFEQNLSFAWNLDFGQLYRHLGRLEADGLVEQQRVAQTGRPDRKVYQLTGEGQKELAAWLRRPVEDGWQLHSEFYLKLALWPPEAPRAGLLPLIDAQVAYYERYRQQITTLADSPDGGQRHLLEVGRRHADVELTWLAELRRWAEEPGPTA